ncbi:DUF4097 family beta strand repeat-containing protein [Kitasatospora sp. NPDC004289]
MAVTRTLTASATGATTLDLTLLGLHGQVDVQAVPGLTTAEVTISTTDDTGEAADAVNGARLSDQGGTLTVRVQGKGGAGGTTVVRTSGRGGTVVMQSAGTVFGSVTGVVISGGDVSIVGGRVIGGQGVTVVQGPAPIVITARLPERSALTARTQSADVTTHGGLASVTATSQSGDVRVLTPGSVVDRVRAETQSGDVEIGTATTATVRTQSGDVRLERVNAAEAHTMSGDVRAEWTGTRASLATMSGDIRAHAGAVGQVSATSMSGDVTVTASPEALAGGVAVHATSMSGRVRTPQPAGH